MTKGSDAAEGVSAKGVVTVRCEYVGVQVVEDGLTDIDSFIQIHSAHSGKEQLACGPPATKTCTLALRI